MSELDFSSPPPTTKPLGRPLKILSAVCLMPAKMKVVQLKQELQRRGLDTKGLKAALVKRLTASLEEEKTRLDSARSPGDLSTTSSCAAATATATPQMHQAPPPPPPRPGPPSPISVRHDGAFSVVDVDAPSVFELAPSRNLARQASGMRLTGAVHRRTAVRSLSRGRGFAETDFEDLNLPHNETLLGFDPSGQYFVVVTSDCKYVKYYYVHMESGGRQNSDDFGAPPAAKKRFTSWTLDESMDVDVSSSSDAQATPPRRIRLGLHADATLPVSYTSSDPDDDAADFRFMENDVASVPLAIAMPHDGGFALSAVARPAMTEGDTPGRGAGERLHCFVLSAGVARAAREGGARGPPPLPRSEEATVTGWEEGGEDGSDPSCGCTGSGLLCLHCEVKEDDETAGRVELSRHSVVGVGGPEASRRREKLVMLANKECVWCVVVAEGAEEKGKEEEGKVKGKEASGVRWADEVVAAAEGEDEENGGSTRFLKKPKLSLGNNFLNLEPDLIWSGFCSKCGLSRPPQAPTSASDLTISSQTNISYEPLIRTVMGQHSYFRKARLTDYAAVLVGADGGAESVVIAVVMELEPRDAHLHVRNGRVPLTLKGAVVSVRWRAAAAGEGGEGDNAKVLQWVAPPPLKGAQAGRAGDSTARLMALAKSLAANYRKRLPPPSCDVLDNSAVLRAVPKMKIVNRVLPCSVVTGGGRF